MIDLLPHIDAIARRVLGVPNAKLSNGVQLRFGTNGSLNVETGGPNPGAWFDHENQIGGGPLDLIQMKGGVAHADVVAWLRNELGIDAEPAEKPKPRIVATYDYTDEHGVLLSQVCRFVPKDFRQRRPDGKGGWLWKVKGTRQVPYRLPKLAAAPDSNIVFVAEGEKDVDTLIKLGLVATCNPGGAAKRGADGKPARPKWRPEFAQFFRGRDVVVLPDNDDAGRDHAAAVAANIAPLARRVRIVKLPGLPPKGDVSDWLAAGGTRVRLEALAETAPTFEAESSTRGEQVEQPQSSVRPAETAPVIVTSAPFTTAKLFLNTHFTTDAGPTLHHHRDAFYCWNGVAFHDFGETELRAHLYSYLDGCVTIDPKGNSRSVTPNAVMVGNVLDGLRAAAHLSSGISAPAWLDQVVDIEAEDLIACINGLLHLPTLSLLRHTPRFFTHNAIDIAFEPGMGGPAEWIRFLEQLWPGDRQAIETLQEIFGYCLTPDTRQQKAFLLVGPKRSGKGTIARVLHHLVGIDNAVAPTLAGLGMNFGLSPLIGKRVAIISDARLGGRADQHAIAERILSVTGEDMISIDRKFLPAWTGRLRTRFLVLTNELPRLADASGALAARFIVMVLTNSFYGREDHGLTDRLLAELPGILNWSIAGLNRLRQRGHFVQPASATEAVQDLEDLGSPIAAFVRERCHLGTGQVARKLLFDEWGRWCQEQGRDRPGTQASFGRDLVSAFPAIHRSQPRDGDARLNLYDGIGIKW